MKSHLPHFQSGRTASWIRRLLVCVVILMGCANFPAETPSSTIKHFPKPDRIHYDDHCLTIDGREIFIRNAAFHYFRTPRELWRDRFQKIKDAGFNTVETYVPWNWHEREMLAPTSASVVAPRQSGSDLQRRAE